MGRCKQVGIRLVGSGWQYHSAPIAVQKGDGGYSDFQPVGFCRNLFQGGPMCWCHRCLAAGRHSDMTPSVDWNDSYKYKLVQSDDRGYDWYSNRIILFSFSSQLLTSLIRDLSHTQSRVISSSECKILLESLCCFFTYHNLLCGHNHRLGLFRPELRCILYEFIQDYETPNEANCTNGVFLAQKTYQV